MCFSDIIYITFQKYDFFHNHQENHKKSASYQEITTKSTVNYKLLTVNYKLLFPGGSEHRVGRLHPLVPEGREAW